MIVKGTDPVKPLVLTETETEQLEDGELAEYLWRRQADPEGYAAVEQLQMALERAVTLLRRRPLPETGPVSFDRLTGMVGLMREVEKMIWRWKGPPGS